MAHSLIPFLALVPSFGVPLVYGTGNEGWADEGGLLNSCRLSSGSALDVPWPRARFTEDVVLPARLDVFCRDIGGGTAGVGRWEATDKIDSVGEAARSVLH